MILNLVHTVAFLIGFGRQSLQKQAQRPCNALCPCSGQGRVKVVELGL